METSTKYLKLKKKKNQDNVNSLSFTNNVLITKLKNCWRFPLESGNEGLKLVRQCCF